MVSKIIVLLFIFGLCALLGYIIKKLNNLEYIFEKHKYNSFEIDKKIDTIQGYQIATYNNAIRIAKKLGVYFSINKEGYEEHKKLLENGKESTETTK